MVAERGLDVLVWGENQIAKLIQHFGMGSLNQSATSYCFAKFLSMVLPFSKKITPRI